MASDGVAINIIIIEGLSVLPALVTVIGNLVFFITLVKTRSLHTPANVLLGALCLCDLFVGFIVQPLFIIIINRVRQDTVSLTMAYFNFFAMVIGEGSSFLLAMMISVDRYIAICHPFKYIAIANCRRYIYINGVMVLVFCGICAAMRLLRIRYIFVVLAIMGFIAFSIIIFTYGKIYRVIVKQRKVAVTIGEISGVDRPEIHRQRKERGKTYTFAVLLGILLVCYTPSLGWLLYSIVFPSTLLDYTPEVFIFSVWARFISMLNSCVNPLVYCLRSTDIRKAAFRMLRIKRGLSQERSGVAGQ